jgi:serine/threonine protein kinase
MSIPDANVAPLREGEILDGKYRVDKVLGVGGMGVVVAATHVQLHQKVALKFLLPQALANPQVIERFAREARAAVQIQSEHVARVSDVGTLPTGSPYMVMEFLEGADLAEVVSNGGSLPVETAVGYVLQACEAIAEAHSLGIVHRDLKPANLFLANRYGRDPVVKVLDFGISKTKESTGGLTATAAVMGSPLYMAPEQMMSSKDVDARTDIWALGVILYELLTGITPFVGESMPEIVFLVTQRDPEPLQQARPDVPSGVAAAVAKCLMRDRAQRFQNVAELVMAIAPFGPARSDVTVERVLRLLGTVPSVAVSLRSSTESSATGGSPRRQVAGTSATWATQSGAKAQPQGQAGEKRKTTMIVAIAAAALVGVVAVVGLLSSGPSKPAEGQNVGAHTAQGRANAVASPTATAVVSPSPPPTPSTTTTETATLAPAPTTSAVVTTPTAVVHAATTPTHARPTTPPPAATPPAATTQPTAQQTSAPTNRLNMGLKE